MNTYNNINKMKQIVLDRGIKKSKMRNTTNLNQILDNYDKNIYNIKNSNLITYDNFTVGGLRTILELKTSEIVKKSLKRVELLEKLKLYNSLNKIEKSSIDVDKCDIILTDDHDMIKIYNINKQKLFNSMLYFEKNFYFDKDDKDDEQCSFTINIDNEDQVISYDILFGYLENDKLDLSLFVDKDNWDILNVLLFVADYFNYEKIINYISTNLLQKVLFDKQLDIAELLLQHPIINLSDLDHSMWLASDLGYTDIVKLLLQNPKVDPSILNNKALRLAVENGHSDIVKLLLQDPRTDPSVQNNKMIIFASGYGYTNVVEVLLQDPRVDPSVWDNNALISASEGGYTDVVKLLLQDPNVDPSVNRNEAMEAASYLGYTDIVQLLIQDPRFVPTSETLTVDF